MFIHLNKLESPFTQECFVPSLVEIGPVVLEKMKMWKVYDNNNDDNDDDEKADKFWSEKLTWSIGSVELKINNYFNPSMGLIRRWWTTIILSQMWQNISVTDVPAIVVFFFWILPFIFLISLSLKLLDLELLLTVVMNIILIMLEYWHFPNYVKYTGWIWKNLKLIKLTQSIVCHMLYFLN